MDNNKVSIDNLVRQRMGGAEEKEREGSWLHMRELLDKEMPQDKPFGFGWGRSLIYAGVVLLFSSIGIGAYQFSTHNNLLIINKNSAVALNNQLANRPINSNSDTKDATALANNSNKLVNNGKYSNNNETTPETALTHVGNIDGKTATRNSIESNVVNNKISTNKTSTNIISIASNNIVAQKLASKVCDKNRTSKTTDVNNKLNTTSIKDKQIGQTSAKEVNLSSAVSNNKKLGNVHPLINNKLGNSGIAKSSVFETNKDKGVNKDKIPKKVSNKNDANNDETTVTINKIVLNRRFVRNESNSGYYIFDTISKEKLYEQLHAITSIAETGTESKNGTMENAVASNASVTTGNKPETSSTILSASPSLNTMHESKTTSTGQKGAGAKMLANLSTAFNDIKDNARAMQFTKGLTGGVNGTFFGPTSFYGFHFGVMGNFNFGDNVAVMTELKYFHRINSNYQLSDDYYAYESNNGGGGGWKKSKIDYDFSFSTLQSFELPISIKYTVNNFSFFAGGNLLYTFGISTGAAPLPDPTYAVQIVSTKGNDDHPNLSYKDFGDRFGVGYLLGISFRFSPSVALDLRSVQTVWDNVNTSGGKTVSNTLYKSPSIQFSVNYRLGAPKKENMDR